MSRRASLPTPNFRGKGSRKSRKAAGGSGPGRGNHPIWILLIGILLGGGGVWYYDHLYLTGTVNNSNSPVVRAGETRHAASLQPPTEIVTVPPVAPIVPAPSPHKGAHLTPPSAHLPVKPPVAATVRPRVAIVMDDAGASLQQIEPLGRLESRLTLAVIPFLRDSVSVADYWHGKGREVILHLPMEADDNADHAAGEGALRPGMPASAVRETVLRDLAAVPHITGVNNHMGSRATTDPRLMHDFLGALKPSGLYFLDSRTSGSSIAYATARELGVRAAMRNGAFLDNERSPAAIHAALALLLQQARTQGGAIGIGHVTSPETIAVLARELPGLARDYDFVYASELAQ